MFKLTVPVKQAVAAHAQEYPEQEVCGVILTDGSTVRLDNEHATPETDFQLPIDTLPRFGDSLAAVYHSHWEETSPALLSPFDIQNARASQTPYLMFHTGFGQWDLYDPDNPHPWPLKQKHVDPKKLKFYEGWPWEWGRADCLTIFRAYYKGILGVSIEDFHRVGSEEEYAQQLKAGTWNRYNTELEGQGMVKVHEGDPQGFKLRKHDLLLLRLYGRNPHHVGILVDPVKYLFLHHLQQGELSKVDAYGRGRMRQTCSVWRHQNFA